MAKTYEELLEQAAIIRDETAAGKNTATRVGGTITDAVDYVKELQDTYAGIHAEAAEAKDTAAAAKTTATTAMNTARSASLNAAAANGTANEAKTESAQAVSTAQDAKEAADAAKTTAEQAKKSATNAFDSARSAVFTATAASGTANEAKETADAAKATADAAQAAAETAQTTAAALLRDTPLEGRHMNMFTETGEYHIHGERTDANDGLPILNAGSGHTIDARLTVLDSSLTNGTGEKTDIVVTQILRLSNRTGGDGHVYVRTAQAANKSQLATPSSTAWGTWEKLMGIFEKNAVKNIADLDTYTTNGMYSGLFANTTFQTLGGLKFTPGDTFLLITVNGYAASAFGTPQLTQMLYKLPSKKGSGNSSARMYLRTAYWDKNAEPKAWEFANWDRLATASEISGGGGGSIEEYNRLIELIAANTEKISSVESTANSAKSAAETAQTAANAAQETANSARETATAASTAAQEAKSAAETAQATANDAKQAADNEATARTEADTELQSQINGKQDNIGSFSADEKNALLVSLGLGKIGVISQNQNWKSDYSSYTVSDVVKGIIPQYIIDHWISLSSQEKSYYGTVYFRFNEETGYFECNDLVDITLNDAINIMQYGQTETFNKSPNEYKKVRVVFCANLGVRYTITGYLGTGQYTERVYCQGVLPASRCFAAILDGYDLVNCPRLRDVLYINLINNSKTYTFKGFNSLTTFLGIKMKGNFSFKDSPLLSNESILFLINNEVATSAITITLHPDAYARAMANADILAALETHTNVSLASAQ